MQLTVPNFELDCCGLRVSGSIRLTGGLGSTEWARFDWALFDGLDWMGWIKRDRFIELEINVVYIIIIVSMYIDVVHT